MSNCPRGRFAMPLLSTPPKAWQWFRNPIPPAKEADVIFGHVRNALSLRDDTFVTDVAFSQISDEDDFIRPQFEYDVLMDANDLGFFQRNNPVVRRVVLRRRQTLEDEGRMPRIAVDVHSMKDQTLPSIFRRCGFADERELRQRLRGGREVHESVRQAKEIGRPP